MLTYSDTILEFARIAHSTKAIGFKDGFQTRKYNKEPYINHPIRVAENAIDIAVEYGYGVTDFPFIKSISYLHDILEDTTVTENELCDFLEPFMGYKIILNSVKVLSKPKGEFDLIDDYLYKIKTFNPFTLIVKLADLRDNMSDLRGVNQKALDKYKLIQHYLKY